MLVTVIIAMLVILLALSLWVGITHLSRCYAARHPELGPAKEEGMGCGKTCGCSRAERAACPNRGTDP